MLVNGEGASIWLTKGGVTIQIEPGERDEFLMGVARSIGKNDRYRFMVMIAGENPAQVPVSSAVQGGAEL